MERLFFGLGAVSALLAVALGAFGAHGLRARLSPDMLAAFEVGVRYHMYHALALRAVDWAARRWPGGAVHAAGRLFVAGMVVFSGSLYLLALTGQRWLGAITPLGGARRVQGSMPNITIQWYAGRTNDQKRELTRAITEAVVKIGKTTTDQVHIVFQDVEKSDWGWNGKLASD